MDGRGRSEQIDKALLHLPELPNTQPHKEAGGTEAKREARQIELALTAEQAPAKSIDHAHKWIEGVNQTPLIRDEVRAEADRRYIKPQLHDERNDVTEIPILDVERRDPYADTEACHERDRRECRQQQNL